MSEPSQRAKDISKEICDSYNATLPLRGLAIVIQAALDAERADMDREIGAAMKAKDQRIAELEKDRDGWHSEMNDYEQRIAKARGDGMRFAAELLRNSGNGLYEDPMAELIESQADKLGRDSVPELEAEIQNHQDRIMRMAALLDRVRHEGQPSALSGRPPCAPDCPACAWTRDQEQ